MFLEDYQLEQTLNILNNKSKWKPALLNDLAEWAENELDLTVINYFLDTLSDNRPRIIILVWDDEERNRFFDKIQKKLTKILKKYDKYKLYSNGAPCVFTSKQMLDEKYDGNMYYYLL